MLTPVHVTFYIFASIAVISAIAVISTRNPVRSVLSLVITFFSMSVIWMLLRAEFLSLTLLLVYVGAVMTLFLFVVMMLNIDNESKKSGLVKHWVVGFAVVLLLTSLLVINSGPYNFGLLQMPAPAELPADYSNTHEVGFLLFTQYIYAFEVAGVLLLSAMVAAITLAHRPPRRRKVQNVADQIAVRPEDRVHLIKMPPEPKPQGDA